jgi:chemotaxis protein CheD
VANVGPRNASFVREFLKTEGIRISAEDLEDIYPRKLYYFPRSGRVMVKKLRSGHSDRLVEREQAYRKQLVQQPVGGEVELF